MRLYSMAHRCEAAVISVIIMFSMKAILFMKLHFFMKITKNIYKLHIYSEYILDLI